MGFSVSSLDSNSGSGVSNFDTAAVSAPEGSLLVLWAFVHSNPDYSPYIDVGSITGTGLTWSQEIHNLANGLCLDAWLASVPAGGISAEAMTVALTQPANGYVYALDLVQGAAYFSPLVSSNDQTGNGTAAGSTGLTFNTAAKTSSRFLYCAGVTPGGGAPPQAETDGYTVIDNLAVSPYYYMTLQTQVSPDSTSVDASSDWEDGYDGSWWANGLELSYCGC